MELDSSEFEIQEAELDDLPTEILELILNYGSTAELLTLRSVCKRFNATARVIFSSRQSFLPITFWTTENLANFISLLENSTTQQFPFSAYEFHIAENRFSEELLQRFLEHVGYDAKSYTIHLDDFTAGTALTFQSLLENSLNLRQLCIEGNIGYCPTITRTLPKLKSLQVISRRDRWTTSRIETEMIMEWIKQMPNLQELHCDFDIRINANPNFIKLLQVPIPFKSVSVYTPIEESEAIPILSKLSEVQTFIQELELKVMVVRSDWSTITTWLNTISQTLNSLRFRPPPKFNLNGTHFHNLQNLKLDFTNQRLRGSVESQLSASQFPVLKTIILENYLNTNHDSNFRLFREQESLEAVHHLYLVGNNNRRFLDVKDSFEKLFPNLKTFGINGGVTEEHMNYVFSHFPDLESLALLNFNDRNEENLFSYLSGGDDGKSFAITQSGEMFQKPNSRQHNICESPLRNMKRLKVLEIGSKATFNGVLLGLAYLTTMKKIQKLDYLGMYGLSLENEFFARLVQEKVNGLKWHKVVSQRILENGPASVMIADKLRSMVN